MLKKNLLGLAVAALLAGTVAGCAGDEGGGGGDVNDTGTYESQPGTTGETGTMSDDDTGRMDGTMDTRDDERSGGGGGVTDDPVRPGTAP